MASKPLQNIDPTKPCNLDDALFIAALDFEYQSTVEIARTMLAFGTPASLSIIRERLAEFVTYTNEVERDGDRFRIAGRGTEVPNAKYGMHSVTIGNATLLIGDSQGILESLDPSTIDACVTDPPYGLSFMGKLWDYDVPQADLWQKVWNTLKPGAHLLSFSSARTYHRMGVAVEDAGFEIRDQLMWLYGSGMPKNHNIGKAIEALKTTGGAGPINMRKAAMGGAYAPTEGAGTPGYGNCGKIFRNTEGHAYGQPRSAWEGHALKLSDDDAKAWDGWGTALKPSHEPIVMARKPFRGSCTANVLQHGTGALNIDACRVGEEVITTRINTAIQGGNYGRADGRGLKQDTTTHTGRWPANVLHDGSDAVLAEFPDVRTGKGSLHQRKPNAIYGERGSDDTGELSLNGGDSGSAARFFYCAKASVKDRDEGLEGMTASIPMPFHQTGGGTSGTASMPEKAAKNPRANNHPTVKPTDLMRYLCRLVTAPGGVILDPFMGSGSTGKAAVLEGFHFIGIERDPAYFEIACARIAAAQGLSY